MKKLIMTFLLSIALLPALAWAADEEVKLDHPNISMDHQTLQRGAKIFATYCLSCHSAKFMRYNRLTTDLGMPESVVKEEIMRPAGAKYKGLMTITMSPDDAQKWFGVTPPDLSVEARARGVDWLYTYLRSFYRDPSRPSGWNNHVFPMVAMPGVLSPLQGEKDKQGNLLRSGEMTPQAFDQTVSDLVAFLDYLGEPNKLERKQMGFFVLAYLFIFTILAYLVKRAYWRDVH